MPSDANSQSESRKATQARTKPAARSLEDRSHRLTQAVEAPAELASDSQQQHAPALEKAIVTAGKAGEQHITIDWFWVPVDGHRPAGFNVKTLDDHSLEVLMEQLSYRKTWAGTGAVKTGVTPIAPVGTRGRLLAKDITTGETLEQTFVWRRIGGSGLSLWERFKRLFFREP